VRLRGWIAQQAMKIIDFHGNPGELAKENLSKHQRQES
jgi:hypothetical protein